MFKWGPNKYLRLITLSGGFGWKGHWQWPSGELSLRSKFTVSTMLKGSDWKVSARDDWAPSNTHTHTEKKKKSMMWPVAGLLLNQPVRQQARWPLGKLAVRPSVSSLPIRPSTVKRSRGGLCKFVNLKHQETNKSLHHCQHVWHLSRLCRRGATMPAEQKAPVSTVDGCDLLFIKTFVYVNLEKILP